MFYGKAIIAWRRVNFITCPFFKLLKHMYPEKLHYEFVEFTIGGRMYHFSYWHDQIYVYSDGVNIGRFKTKKL